MCWRIGDENSSKATPSHLGLSAESNKPVSVAQAPQYAAISPSPIMLEPLA